MALEIIEDWLFDAIEFYRPLGFFKAFKGDDEALVDKLLPLLEEQQEGQELTEADLESPELDLFFLSFDPARTLYENINFGASLGPGLEAYVNIIKTLAHISRGTFSPTEISERWESPEGPIALSFLLNGQKKTIKIDTWNGVFDFRILLQLNEMIWDTPFRYEMAPMDDILFITVLNAGEKTKIERFRDLSFMVLDLPRCFLPLAKLTPPLSLSHDPEAAVFFCGTLNENLDRCVGKLRLILRGNILEGHHLFQGDTHQENLTFSGSLNEETSKIEGVLSGTITVKGELRPYEGSWQGQLAQGNRVISGSWQGWFVHDKESGHDKPNQNNLIYKGQLGLLEEESLNYGNPYINRAHAWLEQVWACHTPEDYPWLYPL